jgi:hypothetical protein
VRSAAVAQAPDQRNREAEAANIARLTVIDPRIVAIDQELAAKFPEYAALASPPPLSVEDMQGNSDATVKLITKAVAELKSILRLRLGEHRPRADQCCR